LSLRVLGIDALQAAGIAPALLPHMDATQDRLAILDPDAVFANGAALLRLDVRIGDAIELRGLAGWRACASPARWRSAGPRCWWSTSRLRRRASGCLGACRASICDWCPAPRWSAG
jgi:hypothetical protein